jgi:tRNA pseudouridine synthase 9
MALVPSPVRDKYPPLPDDIFPWKEPPKVVITPCNPWPPPYYLEDGLRKVTPYHYTYNTFCKERWRGREILDIFASEFRDRPQEYYEQAIKEGRVVLNGKQVPSTSTIVKNGDVISHTLHRHEPPCTASPIGIVHEDDNIIVIDKPAGMPVHPAGRYNFNSIIEVLRADRGYGWNPLPCNRLDRLTSGIMFIGKHKAAAEDMSAQIRGRTVKKEYICRVVGEFPEGEVVCEKPILQISPKLGLNAVRANGRESRTVFKRLAYYPPKDSNSSSSNGDSEPKQEHVDGQPWKKLRGYSIVRCFPVTGRTHQLRVHLQYLGHPISNDPIYANQRVFGPALASTPIQTTRTSWRAWHAWARKRSPTLSRTTTRWSTRTTSARPRSRRARHATCAIRRCIAIRGHMSWGFICMRGDIGVRTVSGITKRGCRSGRCRQRDTRGLRRAPRRAIHSPWIWRNWG